MLFKPLFFPAGKHLFNLIKNRNYFYWCWLDAKLGKVARFKEQTTKIDGWKLRIPDAASFLAAYKEIFVNNVYFFEFSSDSPRILDLGANIGISILYFKTLFPKAEITGFEPDPKIFRYLKENIHENGLLDVELINKAVWNKNETLEFSSEGADGGRILTDGDKKTISIEAIDIKEVLQKKQYDFLKMDIEGAEVVVLGECLGLLSSIKYIFIEFHSFQSQKQMLSDLLSVLSAEGFRVEVQNLLPKSRPFIRPALENDIDMMLNIFAWRET